MTELARQNLQDSAWTLAVIFLALEIIRSMVRLASEFLDWPR